MSMDPSVQVQPTTGRPDPSLSDNFVAEVLELVALNDRVIQSMFSAGMGVHGLGETADLRQDAVIYQAINDLDTAIRELRVVVFDHQRRPGR